MLEFMGKTWRSSHHASQALPPSEVTLPTWLSVSLQTRYISRCSQICPGHHLLSVGLQLLLKPKTLPHPRKDRLPLEPAREGSGTTQHLDATAPNRTRT